MLLYGYRLDIQGMGVVDSEGAIDWLGGTLFAHSIEFLQFHESLLYLDVLLMFNSLFKRLLGLGLLLLLFNEAPNLIVSPFVKFFAINLALDQVFVSIWYS